MGAEFQDPVCTCSGLQAKPVHNTHESSRGKKADSYEQRYIYPPPPPPLLHCIENQPVVCVMCVYVCVLYLPMCGSHVYGCMHVCRALEFVCTHVCM